MIVEGTPQKAEPSAGSFLEPGFACKCSCHTALATKQEHRYPAQTRKMSQSSTTRPTSLFQLFGVHCRQLERLLLLLQAVAVRKRNARSISSKF